MRLARLAGSTLVLAGLTVLTGTAASAQPSAPAFRLSISPSIVIGQPHARHLAERLTLTNGGSKVLRVTSSFELVQRQPGQACHLTKPPSWVTISPAVFTLRPGQARNAQLTVNAPRNAHGHWDLAALFAGGSAKARGGQVGVAGAVGARVLLSLGGKTTAKPCAVAAPPNIPEPIQAPHGPSLLLWSAVGLGVLVLALLILAAYLRRRRMTT